jgi:hypothetical protein
MREIPKPTGKPQNKPVPGTDEPSQLVEKVNAALAGYSDKDWNYSRIKLLTSPLRDICGPYTLAIDVLDQNAKKGQAELKTLADEVKWGDRHSSELGMLEIVSLRINKALLETTSDDYWNQKRPVVRVAKKEAVDIQALPCAIWYQIIEVAGEDFDNR